jgi:SAM-dependent methyltransferase
MSFDADWLALRAPADAAARAPEPLARLEDWAKGAPIRVVDLGCGTGATHRTLAPRLPGARWTLVDSDPALLEIAAETGAETRRLDLAEDVEAAVAEADLVTASALFDLASADWIARLAAVLPPTAALYAALTYDGRERWEPPHPAEPAALAAFHAHQRGPKGLGAGAALGPEATHALAARLAGRRLLIAPSPWRLSDAERPLIEALADGAAGAVAETGALDAETLVAWRAARRAAATVEVGHLDLLALPA